MPGPVIPLIGKATPALHFLVQMAIEHILHEGDKVLEFGSGHSTIWFADLGCDVVSVEYDNDWYDAVRRWLYECNHKASQWLVSPEQMAGVAQTFKDEYFDLVLVDGYSTYRPDCVRESKNKIKQLGWMVVDDIQVGTLSVQSDTILQGWHRTDMRALHIRKDGQVRMHQTAFFRKPKCI